MEILLCDSKLGTYLKFRSTYCPQTYNQRKVVSRRLDNILRVLAKEHPKQWDQILEHIDFACNNSLTTSTCLNTCQSMNEMHLIVVYNCGI